MYTTLIVIATLVAATSVTLLVLYATGHQRTPLTAFTAGVGWMIASIGFAASAWSQDHAFAPLLFATVALALCIIHVRESREERKLAVA